jgi:hypothetical protein
MKNRVGNEGSNCIRNFTAILAQLFNSHGFQTYRQLYGIDFMQELACSLLGPRWGKNFLSYVTIRHYVPVEQIFKFLTVHLSVRIK